MAIYFVAKRNLASGYNLGDNVTISNVNFDSFDSNYNSEIKKVRLRSGDQNQAMIWYKKEYTAKTTSIDPEDLQVYQMFAESVINGEPFSVDSPDGGTIYAKMTSPASFNRIGYRVNLFNMSFSFEEEL